MWLQLITSKPTPAHFVQPAVQADRIVPFGSATNAATALATPTSCTVKKTAKKESSWEEEEKNEGKRNDGGRFWAWCIIVVHSLIDNNFLITRSRFADTSSTSGAYTENSQSGVAHGARSLPRNALLIVGFYFIFKWSM